MRKNAIDKTLTHIDGGICAPEGFSAGAVYCGIAAKGTPFYQENREDLALIVSNKLVPTACVYANEGVCGAPVCVTKKHLRFFSILASRMPSRLPRYSIWAVPMFVITQISGRAMDAR